MKPRTGGWTGVRPYLSLLSARVRTLLQYRAAALAGVGTQVFWGLIRMMIFQAFYLSHPGIQAPMSLGQVVSYVWLGQAFLLLTLWFVDSDVAGLIRTGAVAYELVRPVDLWSLWFARAVAGRTAPLGMRALPILLVGFVFFGLQAPTSVTAGILFVVAIGAAILLASSITVLLTTSLFWTVSGDGVTRLAPPVIFVLSGMIIPLPLFPGWLQPVLALLPFRGLIDTPFRIYLGHMGAGEALWSIGHTGVWTIGFVIAARFVLARGLKHLVVQGG